MKYSLIVHDLTAESLPTILAKLNGTTAVAVQQHEDDDDAGVADGAPTDKDGIPWDARIHATTQTKTAKGVWKRLKGISDELYDAVKAELKASNAAPSPNAFAGVPVTQGAPSAVASTLDRLEQTMGVKTPPPPPPAAAPTPAAPAPAPAPAPTVVNPNDRSFNAFTQKMGRLYGGNHVSPDYGNNLVSRINSDWKAFGKQINTITDVANDEQLLDYVWKMLEVDGFGAV